MKTGKNIKLRKCAPAVETARIIRVIRGKVLDKFRKKGVVIGLSGGVDSSVTACLAVRALGRDMVKALILPERETSIKSIGIARSVAKMLKINAEISDITDILAPMGVYSGRERIVKNYFPSYVQGDPYRVVQPPDMRTSDQLNVPILEARVNGRTMKELLAPADYLEIIALTNLKIRTRMLYLYNTAEKHNYAVMGTTNRTEFDLGFYVKYGDGGTDLEPLIDTYKTNVYVLAKYLGVPKAAIERPPSPDIYSLWADDSAMYFRLPYPVLDDILSAIEAGFGAEAISKSLKLPLNKTRMILRDISSKKRAAEYLRATAY
ncbi:MAG: NAD(+) synthase [Patescibacteria group bacterium]|nr:NAD(+) synthase [Patescibacteria group bacterium]